MMNGIRGAGFIVLYCSHELSLMSQNKDMDMITNDRTYALQSLASCLPYKCLFKNTVLKLINSHTAPLSLFFTYWGPTFSEPSLI